MRGNLPKIEKLGGDEPVVPVSIGSPFSSTDVQMALARFTHKLSLIL
jgi:hypothetical protein